MKTLKLYIIALFLVIAGTSCEDEDFTGQASLTPTAGVTASIDAGDMSGSFAEAAQDTIRVTLSLSELQSGADAVFFATQVGGDATLGEDVVFINEDGLGLAKKTIPATSDISSLTWSIVVLDDCAAEANETIQIQFGDERTANVSVDPVTAEITVVNNRSSIASVAMGWGTDLEGEDIVVSSPDEDIEIADIDMDLELYDAGFNLVNYSWYDNPEEMDLSNLDGSALADGVYYIVAYQFASVDIGPFDPVSYPVTFDFSRCGGTLNASTVVSGFDTDGFQNPDGSYSALTIAYTATVAGDNITLNDGVADIASGKMEELKAAIANQPRR